MVELDDQLQQWRDDTQDLEPPSALIDRINERLMVRAGEAISSGATPLADLEDTEIGALLDQTLMTDPKLKALSPTETVAPPPAVRISTEIPPPPAEVGAAVWHLGMEGRELGPLASDRIAELWSVGEIGPDTLCWRPGFSDWTPLVQVSELLGQIAPRPATPVRTILPEPPEPEPPRPVALLTSLAEDEIRSESRAEVKPVISRRTPTEPSILTTTSRASWPVLAPPPERMTWSSLPRGLVAGLVLSSFTLVAMLCVVVLLWIRAAEPPAPQHASGVAPRTLIADATPVPEIPAVSAPAKLPEVPAASDREESKPAPVVTPATALKRHRPNAHSAADTNGVGEQIVASAARGTRKADNDDFASVFGEGQGGKNESKGTKKSSGGGAGAASSVPERLSSSDVTSVVLDHKADVVRCVDAQRKHSSGNGGRLVMRWRIRPNGTTHNVSVQSEELKDSPLASCLTHLIQTWVFPRHQNEGDPTDFPFAF